MARAGKPLDANALLASLVDLIANGNALPTQFERMARDLGIAPGAMSVLFLSGVKKIVRELPDKAFADRNARLAMVDAIQDALDQAIELEEEMQANAQEEDL